MYIAYRIMEIKLHRTKLIAPKIYAKTSFSGVGSILIYCVKTNITWNDVVMCGCKMIVCLFHTRYVSPFLALFLTHYLLLFVSFILFREHTHTHTFIYTRVLDRYVLKLKNDGSL